MTPQKNNFEIFYYCDNIEVFDDKGYFKSINDVLDYGSLSVLLSGMPFCTGINSFSFYFPPNFSRRINLNITGKGNSDKDGSFIFTNKIMVQ